MKKYFITGLIVLLPLVVTIAVVVFLVNLLTKPFMGLMTALLAKFDIINRGILFLSPQQTLEYGSKLIILVLLFFVVVLIGMITKWFFIKALLNLGDKILHRIPLVNKVYKTTQDIINTLFVSDKDAFKQVVMAPFPHKNSYVIGLISREAPTDCSEKAERALFSVLIPTTPNPTTGFLIMFKREDLIFLEMKPEEAIKYIVSCGVIIPEEKTPVREEKSS